MDIGSTKSLLIYEIYHKVMGKKGNGKTRHYKLSGKWQDQHTLNKITVFILNKHEDRSITFKTDKYESESPVYFPTIAILTCKAHTMSVL